MFSQLNFYMTKKYHQHVTSQKKNQHLGFLQNPSRMASQPTWPVQTCFLTLIYKAALFGAPQYMGVSETVL